GKKNSGKLSFEEALKIISKELKTNKKDNQKNIKTDTKKKKVTIKKKTSSKKSNQKEIIKKNITKKNVVKKQSTKKKTVKKEPKVTIKKKTTKKKIVKQLSKLKETKIKKEIVEKSILKRSHKNPIIKPNYRNHWESYQTFNPGVVKIGDEIHFLYRAIGSDGVSRLGYAKSKNGYDIHDREDFPVYEDSSEFSPYSYYCAASGGSWSGAEDPRLVRVDDEDKIYVTFTSCSDGLRMGISSIELKDFVKKRWNWKKTWHLSPPGEVHKNWVIFPNKINGKYAIIHSISPEISIEYRDTLEVDGDYIKSYFNPNKNAKKDDLYIRGAGPPPVKTKEGWLLFYHYMNRDDMSKYKIGVMLLDLKNPEKIISNPKIPLLIPEELYELEGFKSGVVYASGAVIKGKNLILYYGGADSFVCAASIELNKLLKQIKSKDKKPIKLKIKKENCNDKKIHKQSDCFSK
ncbi:hypothetical protein KY334_00235, partial [Candidatus Woesearchaeota archaeon]|nr:hypothetical protein [Candidatus Woesearchaeota archaeon]